MGVDKTVSHTDMSPGTCNTVPRSFTRGCTSGKAHSACSRSCGSRSQTHATQTYLSWCSQRTEALTALTKRISELGISLASHTYTC